MKWLVDLFKVIAKVFGKKDKDEKPDPKPDPDPTFPVRHLNINVFPPEATATLTPVGDRKIPAVVAVGEGRKQFTVGVTVPPWGSSVRVEAAGYVPQELSYKIPEFGDHEMDGVTLSPVRQRPDRLSFANRYPTNRNGRYRQRSVSAFKAAFLVATGQEAKLEDFLRWASIRFNQGRVFSTAVNMFDLSPEAGRAAMPRTLEMFADYGMYGEVVGLADTKQRAFDHRGHMQPLGSILQQWDNSTGEMANEPIHSTQMNELGDPEYLASFLPFFAGVPCALGANHAKDDEKDTFAGRGSSFINVHADRDNGGADETYVRHVRHVNEQRALMANTKQQVNNDEFAKDMAPGVQFGIGAMCRLMELGDTFHGDAVMRCEIPQGDEANGVAYRLAGWDCVPPDFTGQYANVNQGEHPVHSFINAERMYGAVGSEFTYVIGVGCNDEEWILKPDKFRDKVLLQSVQGSKLWRFTQ